MKRLFVGASAVDIISQFNKGYFQFLQTSTPSQYWLQAGGVARNMAQASSRLTETLLISPVGNDLFGKALRSPYLDPMVSETGSTPVYNALIDADGSLVAAAASMSLLHDPDVNRGVIALATDRLRDTSILCIDCNLLPQTVEAIVHLAKLARVPVVIEPTSEAKMLTIAADLWTPNEQELLHSFGATREQSITESLNLIPRMILKRGSQGVSYYQKINGQVQSIHLEAAQVKVQNVTGAGDTLVGTFVAQWQLEDSLPVIHQKLLIAKRAAEFKIQQQDEGLTF